MPGQLPTTNNQLPTSKPALLVIVGQTASGKSALAINLAKQFNGEIISADSLTIYKKMDIGTAKPTLAERQGVPHWGFDLVGPGQRFTAADFKDYAQKTIKDITSRGKMPIVVGGTGLYIDALVFDFSFGGTVQPKTRQKLEKLTTTQLQAKINLQGLKMPQNDKNKRHLIRTLERGDQIGQKAHKILPNSLIIGILPDPQILKTRINKRVKQMFADGLVEETQKLIKLYGQAGLLSKSKVAYGPVIEHLSGDIDLDTAKAKLNSAHWQFARRQRTWFKRNSEIQWFSSAADAQQAIGSILNN